MLARRHAERLVEAVREQRAVRQSRQRVAVGEVGDALLARREPFLQRAERIRQFTDLVGAARPGQHRVVAARHAAGEGRERAQGRGDVARDEQAREDGHEGGRERDPAELQREPAERLHRGCERLLQHHGHGVVGLGGEGDHASDRHVRAIGIGVAVGVALRVASRRDAVEHVLARAVVERARMKAPSAPVEPADEGHVEPHQLADLVREGIGDRIADGDPCERRGDGDRGHDELIETAAHDDHRGSLAVAARLREEARKEEGLAGADVERVGRDRIVGTHEHQQIGVDPAAVLLERGGEGVRVAARDRLPERRIEEEQPRGLDEARLFLRPDALVDMRTRNEVVANGLARGGRPDGIDHHEDADLDDDDQRQQEREDPGL